MNPGEIYAKAMNPVKEYEEQEKQEQDRRVAFAKQEEHLAKQAWLTMPQTKGFIKWLKQQELNFMVAGRDICASHGVTDGVGRSLIRSRTYREVIDYAEGTTTDTNIAK